MSELVFIEYAYLSMDQLKFILKARALPVDGNRYTLTRRIRDSDELMINNSIIINNQLPLTKKMERFSSKIHPQMDNIRFLKIAHLLNAGVQFTNIKLFVTLHVHIPEDYFKVLASGIRLTTSVSHFEMGMKAPDIVYRALRSNTSIKTLTIHSKHIRRFNFLPINLTTLEIHHLGLLYELCDDHMYKNNVRTYSKEDSKRAMAIKGHVNNHKSIKKLIIHHFTAKCAAFLDVLVLNKNINDLVLNMDAMNNYRHVYQHMHQNINLSNLNILEINCSTYDSVIMCDLINSLVTNTHIETLKIKEKNGPRSLINIVTLSKEAYRIAYYFETLLSSNKVLKNLDLWFETSSVIINKGIMKGLKYNTSLTSISINVFRDQDRFIDMLSRYRTLKSVRIYNRAHDVVSHLKF